MSTLLCASNPIFIESPGPSKVQCRDELERLALSKEETGPSDETFAPPPSPLSVPSIESYPSTSIRDSEGTPEVLQPPHNSPPPEIEEARSAALHLANDIPNMSTPVEAETVGKSSGDLARDGRFFIMCHENSFILLIDEDTIDMLRNLLDREFLDTRKSDDDEKECVICVMLSTNLQKVDLEQFVERMLVTRMANMLSNTQAEAGKASQTGNHAPRFRKEPWQQEIFSERYSSRSGALVEGKNYVRKEWEQWEEPDLSEANDLAMAPPPSIELKARAESGRASRKVSTLELLSFEKPIAGAADTACGLNQATHDSTLPRKLKAVQTTKYDKFTQLDIIHDFERSLYETDPTTAASGSFPFSKLLQVDAEWESGEQERQTYETRRHWSNQMTNWVAHAPQFQPHYPSYYPQLESVNQYKPQNRPDDIAGDAGYSYRKRMVKDRADVNETPVGNKALRQQGPRTRIQRRRGTRMPETSLSDDTPQTPPSPKPAGPVSKRKRAAKEDVTEKTAPKKGARTSSKRVIPNESNTFEKHATPSTFQPRMSLEEKTTALSERSERTQSTPPTQVTQSAQSNPSTRDALEAVPYLIDNGKRSPYSYHVLAGLAILNSPGHRLQLDGIYRWITSNFSFYRTLSQASFQNSIRHTLSVNKAFYLQERPKSDPNHPGNGEYRALERDGAIFIDTKTPDKSKVSHENLQGFNLVIESDIPESDRLPRAKPKAKNDASE